MFVGYKVAGRCQAHQPNSAPAPRQTLCVCAAAECKVSASFAKRAPLPLVNPALVLQVNYYLPDQLPAAAIAVPLPSKRTADHLSGGSVSMPGSVTRLEGLSLALAPG